MLDLHPFGLPVDPDVYSTYARSCAPATGGRAPPRPMTSPGSIRSRYTTCTPSTGSNPSRLACVSSTDAPQSCSMNASRCAGNAGSSGTYAAPAFSIPSNPTTHAPPCAPRTAPTSTPGRTPNPRSLAANPSARAFNSPCMSANPPRTPAPSRPLADPPAPRTTAPPYDRADSPRCARRSTSEQHAHARPRESVTSERPSPVRPAHPSTPAAGRQAPAQPPQILHPEPLRPVLQTPPPRTRVGIRVPNSVVEDFAVPVSTSSDHASACRATIIRTPRTRRSCEPKRTP